MERDVFESRAILLYVVLVCVKQSRLWIILQLTGRLGLDLDLTLVAHDCETLSRPIKASGRSHFVIKIEIQKLDLIRQPNINWI